MKNNKKVEKAILIDLLLNGAVHAISNTVSITSLSSERITALLKKDELSIEKVLKTNTTINMKFTTLIEQLRSLQLYISDDKDKSNVPINKIMTAAKFLSEYLLKKNNIYIEYTPENFDNNEYELHCNASDVIYFLSRIFVEILNYSPDYKDHPEQLIIKFSFNDNKQFLFETFFEYDVEKTKDVITSFLDSETELDILQFSKEKIILQYC